MKIIHPYGRSVIESKAQIDGKQRVLVSSDTDEKNPYDVKDFLDQTPELIITQWIALINRVFARGKQNQNNRSEKPESQKQKENRSTLETACWTYIKDRIKDTVSRDALEKEKKRFHYKLCAYKTDYTYLHKDLTASGKRSHFLKFISKQIGTKTDPKSWKQTDFQTVARTLDTYLYSNHFDPITSSKRLSLTDNRARSISDSLGGNKKRLTDKQVKIKWEDKDAKTLFDKSWDLAKEIHNEAVKCEKSVDKQGRKRRLHHTKAAALIFNHYKNRFEKNGHVPTRKEIAPNCEDNRTLALYDDIRAYYITLLKRSQKGRDNNTCLSKVLPKNWQELVNKCLRQRQTNSKTNDLIRLGRVLHYTIQQHNDQRKQEGKDREWKLPTPDKLRNSRFWGSDGQLEIKRSESFVRVWRTAISQAARTSRAMIDPEGTVIDSNKTEKQKDGTQILKDVLFVKDLRKDEDIKTVYEDDEISQNIKTHFNLLFGNRAQDLLKDLKDREIITWGNTCLNLIETVRNAGLHFKTRDTFINVLQAIDVDKEKKRSNRTPASARHNRTR